MLGYYGSRLPAVEINNTFYRMPKPSVLEGWSKQVPADFRFVLKASRRITHFKRLKNAEEECRYFVDTASTLGERLGALLFQLPPNFKKDLERLGEFLKILPDDVRAAFEFRHDSWFDDDVFEALRSHNRALCLAETEDKQPELIATADWGYLRLRRADYDKQALERWLNGLRRQEWTECFVFFKHEDEASGPRLAAQFLERAGHNT
ncbi:MAG: DUF72 domain-containing protein [bacterium]|nr:DUF72 domain-containing protein [bacterium]